MDRDKPLCFTNHQLKRMAKRGMSKLIIKAVVKHGEWKGSKKPFSFEVEYKGIIVILYAKKSHYDVSTCKLNREYTKRAESLQVELNTSFLRAVHKVVKDINLEAEISGIDKHKK